VQKDRNEIAGKKIGWDMVLSTIAAGCAVHAARGIECGAEEVLI
jgi:hypothetical protein